MSRRHQDAMLIWAATPRTATVRRALMATRDHTVEDDLLFLEAWERRAEDSVAAALRAIQIRRANPRLAAELRAELLQGRPLTQRERAELVVVAG